MQVGVAYLGSPLDAGLLAREAEEAGAAAFTCGEGEHAAFTSCVAALLATKEIVVGPNIAIAFARSPMYAAMEAYDLLTIGPGRTFYGLGTQIKQVIERRFSGTYDHPVARIREYGEIMRRAIRSKRGEPVEPFEGRFYSVSQFGFHDAPEPELPELELHLAALQPKITELAAAEFDGLLAHGILTPRYIQEVMRPAIGDLFLTTAVMTSIDEDVSAARERARFSLSFYATTPAYSRVFEFEGVPDLPGRLRRAFREQGRDAMTALMPDEILDRFVLIGTTEEVAERLQAYEGIVDRALLGGMSIGIPRPEVVANIRWLIRAVNRYTERVA
jgi:probable F420-dependent oxidoreductase